MRTITLSQNQQRRVEILIRLDAGSLNTNTAAQLLGVSPRHARRLGAGFRQEGMASVIHANQGRASANRIDPSLVQRILALAGPEGPYHDLNVCHLVDLLEGEEQIAIARSTLDRLLRQAGLRGQQPSKPAQHRRRRERRLGEGMLLQMDASPFAWLEERGPKAALLGAVDDATGKIVGLVLRPSEDQAGYFMLLRSIVADYGLPLAIYHDRHTLLHSPKAPTLDEELAGERPMSQLQRLLAELGVESILAYSPQAKGRVERLWGTLQDRLVRELRLAGIQSLEAANAFLSGFVARYNARFAKTPADPNPAWRSLPANFDWAYHFSARETRKVRADHCLRWLGRTLALQVKPSDPHLAGCTVSVHTLPEGEVYVYAGRRRLVYRQVDEPKARPALVVLPPLKVQTPDPKAAARRRAWLFGQR
jgi:transposase